jgi:hypothetical protein
MSCQIHPSIKIFGDPQQADNRQPPRASRAIHMLCLPYPVPPGSRAPPRIQLVERPLTASAGGSASPQTEFSEPSRPVGGSRVQNRHKLLQKRPRLWRIASCPSRRSAGVGPRIVIDQVPKWTWASTPDGDGCVDHFHRKGCDCPSLRPLAMPACDQRSSTDFPTDPSADRGAGNADLRELRWRPSAPCAKVIDSLTDAHLPRLAQASSDGSNL